MAQEYIGLWVVVQVPNGGVIQYDMFHSKAAELTKVFPSPEAGGAFGSLNFSQEAGERLGVIAEIVAYRVGSCVDGREVDLYPSPNDVQEFLRRYIPDHQRTLSNLDELCSITNSAISAVQRNFQRWYMVQPTPNMALHVAVCAHDQGLLAKGHAPSPDEQSPTDRLKAVADQPLWLGCRVRLSGLKKEQDESAAKVKQMAWISKRLQESGITASAGEISDLVDHLGESVYREFTRLWAGEIVEQDEKHRVGVLSCAGRFARELSLAAQGEVILEQVYLDPKDRLAGVLPEAQVVAIERKLGLQQFSLAANKDVEGGSVLPLHLLVLATDGDQDMFVRREALDRLAQIDGDPRDLHHLEQIVASESTPLCVRFAAEVTRRRWVERAREDGQSCENRTDAGQL